MDTEPGGADTLAYGSPSDSILYIIENDTLKFKRVYTIDHPAYSPNRDTVHSAVVRATSPSIQENGLAAAGSITRGIQVSSNSSVSLQSSMYLIIKGNLNDDYTVQGVLTDKTSPLQPIGNTRRLNDFERVLVQIDGPALNASIGDIDLRLRNGKFGKVDRSIEGISVQTHSRYGGSGGALGFSYGQYHLLQIQGKNGKQGPYRLSGKNGEKFIIILAGSEKIKLDDHLLIRGEDEDYIIDYNAAEIHFTQQNILSENSRISVEFEYVPDIYLASYSFGKRLISGEVSFGNRNDSPLFISAAWQDIRDDQNNPLGNVEADELRQIFSELGNATSTAEISSIVRDTLGGSYNMSANGILVYQGAEQGDYTVDFNFVGLDRGQYRKEQNALEPYFIFDPQFGEYLPSQLYVAPQSLSVFSLSGHAQKKGLDAIFDLGISQDTKNLYARSNKGPNKLAWDINAGLKRPIYEIRLGDKYYESGFISHDALESLEYYRQWHLNPRKSEEEHLSYGHLRLGEQNYVKTSISQMERSGVIKGQQLHIDGKSNPAAPVHANYAAVLTRFDSTISQNHNFESAYTRGKLTTGLHLELEDGSSSAYYSTNDHLTSGLMTSYEYSDAHKIILKYDRRLDYRNLQANQTFLNSKNVGNWTDQRQDWIGEYQFANFMNSQGLLNMKYREHLSDSGAVKKYYLGNARVGGQILGDRLTFQEEYQLDEEHIPKYDYHYIEVDTGYGDYSFDPAINDYIPLSGGRFVQQRIFSDREEQVRKYDNKTRLEYSSEDFGNLDKIAIKSRFAYESRLKREVQSNTDIQSQSLIGFNLDFQTGQSSLLTKLGYSGKITRNSSTLYNYGNEDNHFTSHGLDGEFLWNPNNYSKMGAVFESRERKLEYNLLAHEHWTSSRPFINHSIKISPQQKLDLNFQYSLVSDKQNEKAYSEIYVLTKHSLRIRRRGRIDQQLSLSNIQADVQAVPYSVFSGRQPGDNWKYSLNSRYIFSSMFQISMNYSIQKRGDNQSEQYLRVEGRSLF
ncbi:MAG: hypothetical protein K9N29_01320 [Candidatus Marinimicrobia bacterium]|nr:hypothetical protein [Candidatus Neomarinimicrobiota bacterium]